MTPMSSKQQPSASVQAAFGLFDDDSSDEELAPVPHELLHLSPPAAPSSVAQEPASNQSTATTCSLYAPWDDVKPLAVGPVKLVTDCADVGGSRGYVAARDLAPGTQVLVERVYVPWPSDVEQSDPSFFLATMASVLSRPDYADVMAHLSHLFPEQLSELPAHVLAAGRDKYGPQVDELRAAFPALALSHDAVLQNVLAMQCNAFDSGVFLYNAMFNHDCNPNCVKFTPQDVPDATAGVSEVRVARAIRQGEPLTISYLYPREQSRENRQRNLQEQFGFTCNCSLCVRGDSLLTPPTAHDQDDMKPLMPELEKVLVGAEELLKTDETQAAAALAVALETLSDALEVAAHDHLVFMRIHKLVADSCDLLLRANPKQDVREYAILFLRSSYELLELQRTYLNPEHIDLARTLNDVSQGIQLLLSYDPKVLLEEFPEWKDFRQASMVENEYRQEYQRLKSMYE